LIKRGVDCFQQFGLRHCSHGEKITNIAGKSSVFFGNAFQTEINGHYAVVAGDVGQNFFDCIPQGWEEIPPVFSFQKVPGMMDENAQILVSVDSHPTRSAKPFVGNFEFNFPRMVEQRGEKTARHPQTHEIIPAKEKVLGEAFSVEVEDSCCGHDWRIVYFGGESSIIYGLCQKFS
jgi:hypothetical protein